MTSPAPMDPPMPPEPDPESDPTPEPDPTPESEPGPELESEMQLNESEPEPGLEPDEPEPDEPEPDEPELDEPEPDEPDADAEGKVRLSYRERRAESDALAALAKTLVAMKPSQLAEAGLPDELHRAASSAGELRKSARTRELRRISQMLRRLDLDTVTAAIRDASGKQRGRARREHGYEQWRERLVEGGDAVLAEFVDAHPMADFKHLRQLLRQVRRDPKGGKGKLAMRGVLRAIRDACEVEISVASAATEDTP